MQTENTAPATITLTVANPQADRLLANAKDIATPASVIVIDSPEMHQLAISEISALQAKSKELEAARMSITRPLDEAKANAIAVFRPAIDYLDNEAKLYKVKVLSYVQEQERIAKEEQAKRDEAARIAREAAERESARIAAEAKEKADKLAAEAAEAAKAGDAGKAAALEVQAAQVAEEGNHQALVAQAQAPAMAEVVQMPAKVAGTATRKPWKGRVTDKLKFVQYIAANPQYLHLVEVSNTEVNALAKALKENCNVDGMETYQEAQLAVR